MTAFARAMADERTAIIREIDRMLSDITNRSVAAFVALEKLRMWIILRGGSDRKEG